MNLLFITHSGTHKKNIGLFTQVADRVIVLCYKNQVEKQLKRISKLEEKVRQKVEFIPVKNHFDCLLKALKHGKRAGLVFGHDPISGFIAALAGKILRKKTGMMYCQDFLEYFYVTKPGLIKRIIYGSILKFFIWTTCKCSAIFALSEYTRKSAMRNGAKTVYVAATYGVDTANFKPSKKPAELVKKYHLERKKILMCSSRISPEKGVIYAIYAMQKLVKDYPGIVLLLVGKGNEQDKLVRKVKSMGLENNILFMGNIDFEEMPRYYQLCDIFIMPSLKEGLGFAALEALACGKPVVASKVGGIQDGVPEEIGFLFPPGDVDALVEAIKFIAQNPQEVAKRAPKGIAHIKKNFEEKVVTSKFLRYFNAYFTKEKQQML